MIDDIIQDIGINSIECVGQVATEVCTKTSEFTKSLSNSSPKCFIGILTNVEDWKIRIRTMNEGSVDLIEFKKTSVNEDIFSLLLYFCDTCLYLKKCIDNHISSTLSCSRLHELSDVSDQENRGTDEENVYDNDNDKANEKDDFSNENKKIANEKKYSKNVMIRNINSNSKARKDKTKYEEHSLLTNCPLSNVTNTLNPTSLFYHNKLYPRF